MENLGPCFFWVSYFFFFLPSKLCKLTRYAQVTEFSVFSAPLVISTLTRDIARFLRRSLLNVVKINFRVVDSFPSVYLGNYFIYLGSYYSATSIIRISVFRTSVSPVNIVHIHSTVRYKLVYCNVPVNWEKRNPLND